jgi:hypothetical protein
VRGFGGGQKGSSVMETGPNAVEHMTGTSDEVRAGGDFRGGLGSGGGVRMSGETEGSMLPGCFFSEGGGVEGVFNGIGGFWVWAGSVDAVEASSEESQVISGVEGVFGGIFGGFWVWVGSMDVVEASSKESRVISGEPVTPCGC